VVRIRAYIEIAEKKQTFTGESRSFFFFRCQILAVMIESEEVKREIAKVLL